MVTTAVVAAWTAVQVSAVTSPLEIPFRVVENAIIIDAEVNGHKVATVFDTGFSGAFALTESIDFGKPSGTIGVRDFVGTRATSVYDVKKVKFGAVELAPKNMQILAQDGFEGSWSYGTHIDGLMGFDVVAPYVCEINVQDRKIVLHPSTEDITKRVPDNKRTFLLRVLPLSTRHISMATKTADGQTLVMALDTGNAGYATTHTDSLARVGLWTEGKKGKWSFPSYISSGAVETFAVEVKDAKVFGIPVAKSVWDVINLPSSGADSDGTIGFQFLKNFNITIDMKRRAVWMENYTGKFAEDEVATTGITAFSDRKGNSMRVVRVLSESPAQQAGVRVGDVIVAIDGEVIGNVGMRRVEQMLKGAAGSTVKVQVSRSGSLQTFEMKRALLVNPLDR
jgi:hypothetical protein